LDSSTALVAAASGLEPLMMGTRNKHLKDSLVAQISAAVYYKATVMSKLTSNKNFQNKFSTVIFNQIEKDFSEYIDAKARTTPLALHHVYEWKKAGDKEARLFELNKLPQDGLSFQLTYNFKLSKSMVPTKKGKHTHVFANKASVMESGVPVVIAPRSSERIVFEVSGDTVFMPKGASVTVSKPGGVRVKDSFKVAYKYFFTGDLVNQSIKRSGFQRLFNSSISKALGLPSDIRRVRYSFSPNSVRSQADFALSSAFGGMG
jgi:hypothetical protein